MLFLTGPSLQGPRIVNILHVHGKQCSITVTGATVSSRRRFLQSAQNKMFSCWQFRTGNYICKWWCPTEVSVPKKVWFSYTVWQLYFYSQLKYCQTGKWDDHRHPLSDCRTELLTKWSIIRLRYNFTSNKQVRVYRNKQMIWSILT